jgi:hypothetical protein
VFWQIYTTSTYALVCHFAGVYNYIMKSWINNLSPELFWDVSRKEVDPERNERWLIERVLQRGKCKKYGNAGRFLAVRSLAWFEDAESEPDPVFLNGWVWKDVRQRVEKLVEGIIK